MLNDLRYRLRALFRRADMERELDDELRFHLEHETEKHLARGVSRSEAERLARLSFGGVDRIKDDTRDARGISVIDTIGQDLGYAWRGLRSRPGFAAAVVIALALGIGANAVMFGIVDRLLFRPPAYLADADRVHRVYLTQTTPRQVNTERTVEYTRYADLTRWTTAFDKTGVLAYRTLAVGAGEAAREMTIAAASATLFDLFHARPALGRFFTEDEDRPPVGASVIVLSHGFWQSHFGGRDDVLGTRLQVGTGFVTVIGVAPKGFVGITDTELPAGFIPVTTLAGARNSSYYKNYNWGWLEMFARRKPGISVAAANADLTLAYRRSWEAERAISRNIPPIEVGRPHAEAGSIHLSRGPEASADSRVITWVMGVAAIVLLVACANVANLLLARALARRREIALRVALGVSRARLIQQLATESVLLAALGGAAGLALAHWGGRVLSRLFLSAEDAATGVLDARTVSFAAAVTLGVALLTGLAPAIHTLRADVNGALKGGSRDGTFRQSRIATSLLLFQGALSVVLLLGAGLFMRSLSNVRSMRLGYDVEPVVYVSANLRGMKLTPAERFALDDRLLQAARATPGVTSATLAISVPFWSTEGRGTPIVAGRDSLQKMAFPVQTGSTSYFKTTGTRILRGRGFLDSDRANSPAIAVISQSMADKVWPGVDAIGQQFRLGSDTTPFITVVGVAEDIRARLIDRQEEIWYYLPASQFGEPVDGQLFLRVTGNAKNAVETIRSNLQRLMPGAAYVNVTPLSTLVGSQQRSWELGTKMFMALGSLALLLAAIGQYSVIAYAVAQRTRELGVRIALGATANNVVRMIVGQAVGFALVGTAIGSVIALWGGRRIEPLLFQQSSRDPLVFVLVGAVLLVVAIVAAARPAFRAMRVDPCEVLRSD